MRRINGIIECKFDVILLSKASGSLIGPRQGVRIIPGWVGGTLFYRSSYYPFCLRRVSLWLIYDLIYGFQPRLCSSNVKLMIGRFAMCSFYFFCSADTYCRNEDSSICRNVIKLTTFDCRNPKVRVAIAILIHPPPRPHPLHLLWTIIIFSCDLFVFHGVLLESGIVYLRWWLWHIGTEARQNQGWVDDFSLHCPESGGGIPPPPSIYPCYPPPTHYSRLTLLHFNNI